MGEMVDEDPPWWLYEQDPLTALLERQHGIIARWQALRFLSVKALKHRIASQRWHPVHRGVYRTHGGRTPEQRPWIAVLAAGPHTKESGPALLGGITALQAHGLRAIKSDQLHVVVGERRRFTPPDGVVVHRVRIDDDDIHPYSRPPTTTIGRAVVDAAAWARSDDEARLIIVASFQQRLVTARQIAQSLDRMPATHRRLLVIHTARDAAAGSHSLGELGLFTICRRHRLPLPDRQVSFVDSSGRRRYLDAVFDRWRVAVEIDGVQHDQDLAQHWDDIDRDTDLQFAGYRVLRVRVHEVRRQPAMVAAKLRRLLELAGWHTSAG
jgi:hypothetical protein